MMDSDHPPPSTLVSLRILIIDDDPLVLAALQEILRREGHQVTAAQGGSTGIQVFEQCCGTDARFDAVVTDLGMPHVDGRQVASRIKAAAPDTMVLLLTGSGQRIIEHGEILLHVDSVLNKPPKLTDLRAALSLRVIRHGAHVGRA